MWTASVVFMAISAVLLLLAALATIWPHSKQPVAGWFGLFFLSLSLLVQMAHPFGWV
jgi:hypothetical protein